MKQSISLLALALGICLFAAAVDFATPKPILRTTEDPALSAAYDAPVILPATFNCRESSPRKIHTHQRSGARAIAEQPAQSNAANDAGPLLFGQFSTQAARDYNTVQYHSHVPNTKYVRNDCPLCK